MQMKYVVIPVMLAAVIGFAAAPAFAETGTSDTGEKQEREHKALEKLFRKSGPSVHIGQGGRAQLDAAVVTAVSGSDLTVKLFGQTYKINTATAERTEGTPAVDSRVWVKGKANESTGVIDAISVRTFTTAKEKTEGHVNASSTPLKLRGMSVQDELKALMEKLKALRGN